MQSRCLWTWGNWQHHRSQLRDANQSVRTQMPQPRHQKLGTGCPRASFLTVILSLEHIDVT
jgi:hypothetical protein